MTVDVVIEDARWAEADIGELATRATDAALKGAGLAPADWEISLLACDDLRIAGLNAGFRDRARPTNVLSWPSEERQAARPGGTPPRPDREGGRELGDIAIAYETCAREAAAGSIPFADHVTHLLVHGTLHLLGYDHGTEADAALMEGFEVEILATLGVANPY